MKRSDFNIWRVEVPGPGGRAGTTSRFISSTRFDAGPAYSPDGKRIAFVSDRSGNQEIWICDRDGSNQAELTSVGGSLVRPPRWASNSESIAFEANPDGNQDVYLISANGGAPRRLTADRGADQWPDWSKDGQSLYYVRTHLSTSGDTKDIWKIPADGGEAVPITRNANPDIPQASPDGRFVYYSKGYPNPSSSIWRVPIDGGEGTKVLDGVNTGLCWKVTETGIYFLTAADKKGRTDLSIFEFATGKTQKILTIERPDTFDVSPDGRTILYTQLDETGSDLMLVENFR